MNARIGYLFKTPKTVTNYLTTYEGKLTEQFDTYERSHEKSFSPYLTFSGNLKLKRNQKASFKGSLDYSNNRYDYFMGEGTEENSTYSKEHYYRFILGANYTKTWQRNWSMTASLFNFTENSHTNYLLNKNEVKDKLKYSETLYELGLSKRWQKLFVSINGGISQLIFKTGNNENKTVYSPRLITTLKYTATPNISIQYRGEITNSAPTISLFNNIEQKIDRVQKIRGNPSMGVTHIISNRLNINYDINNWSFYFMYDTFISWKNNGEFVSYDNDYFIHSYLTEGHYYYTNPEIGLSYSNHGFLIKTKFGAEHYQITGRNGISDTEWYNKSTASYTLKSLNIGLYYTTYQNGVYASLLKWSHNAVYGFTASYKYKDMSVMLGVQNPFTEYRITKSLFNNIYVKQQKGIDCMSGKYLFVKFSYSLNFGNKKHSYTNTDSNKYMNSAIMKSGVSN